MEMLRPINLLQAILAPLEYIRLDVHQAMLLAQLIALVSYCLTLTAVICYFCFRRKKTAAQAHSVIADNLSGGIETAVKWGSGIPAAVLAMYAAMWFFGSVGTQQTAEEMLELLAGLWLIGGALAFSMTVFLSMAMRGAGECALFARKARVLPRRLIIMGFLTLAVLAFLRC